MGGELVAGAKPGSSGAGCYKLSQDTKKALRKEDMAARKNAFKKDVGGKKSGAGRTVAKIVKGNMAKNSVKGKKIIAISAKKKAATIQQQRGRRVTRKRSAAGSLLSSQRRLLRKELRLRSQLSSPRRLPRKESRARSEMRRSGNSDKEFSFSL